jgi:Putative prokaryotic signal transducing protein
MTEATQDSGDRPVVLRRYRNMPAALVEKSVLDAAGIECFLQDDKLGRMDWLGNAKDWIKLLVREKDAEEAEEILSQTPPSSLLGGDDDES